MRSDKGKLKCDSCGNYHWQWWMISHRKKTSQKIGCASDMIYRDGGYQIRCGYGSGYDTTTFSVVSRIAVNRHPLAIDRLITQVQEGKNPIICDKCIERFIRKKFLIDMIY
jgi:hypothetical protein